MPGPDFSQAVARVWGAGSEPVGSAFLVGPRTLLTCAHVLAHARSGRSRRAQRHPVVPQEGWEVEVDFPQHDTARRHGAQRLTARAVMVAPADGLHGDICVLELLDEEPQLLGRLVLHPLDDLQGRGFRTFGYPADFEDGVSARGRLRGIVGGSWLEAVTDEIEPGFSGAPVWANPLSGVVGMVVARHGSGRAYAVPVRSLFAAHPPLREMALPPSPYRGLEPFEQDDALVFAGRDAMAGELADLVGKHPVTVVHGPSGVGKTSLVRAGVLPRLAASGAATAAVRLHPQIALAAELAAALRIGGEPAPAAVCEELARLLGPPAPAALSAWLESAGADRLVVVLDQLDEVLAADPAAATAIDAYVGRLTRTSDGVPTPVRVLVTARDTFRHLAGEHTPTIYTAWDARGRAVNPPTSAELREMITKPLRTVRCTIASALVEQIVEDTRSSTSALPLVEETLSALYQRQQSGRLTGTAYQDIGGVTGALQQRADDVVDRLRSLEHAPESLLTQLVRPDDTTGERAQGQPPQDVRRVALREDLSDEQWQVAQELATARLVVTTSGVGPSGPGTAELAHQVLIDAWPQLRKWIAASRDFRVWQESLRDALHRWRAAEPGRDRRHALLRATELRLASRWLRQRGDDVRPHERDFIELSRRRRNILRGWLAALVAFIATAVGIVVQQSNSASAHQHALGLSRQLAAHSSGASPAVARQLAVSAWAVAQTDEAGAAVAGLLREARQNSVMVVSTSAVRSLAFTHDGRYLATGADDGTLRRWDARTGGPVGKPVTASQADGRSTRVNAVAFDPDGKVLVTGTGDGRLRGWNPRTGRPAAEPVAFGPVEVTSVAISANGKVMAVGTGGGTLDVWRIPSGDPVRGTTLVGGIVRAVALSPDGKTVATASGDGQLEVWDVESGDRRYAVVASSPASDSSVDVSAVTFSDDGSVLASGGHDGTLRLWNPTTGRPLRKPIPVGSSVNAVAFSPDGKTLATGTDDGTARLWNPTTGRPLRKPIPVGSSVNAVAFSPDGKTLATGTDDGTARLWNPTTGRPPRVSAAIDLRADALAVSPDGATVATGTAAGQLQLWEAATGHPLHAPIVAAPDPRIAQIPVKAVAFSPNGKALAVGTYDGAVRLWDPSSGKPVGAPYKADRGIPVFSLAFSPDGKVLAVGTSDGAVQLLDPATGRHLREPLTVVGNSIGASRLVWAVAFNADGTQLATATGDGMLRVWDSATGRPVGSPVTVTGDGTVAGALTFNPTGTTLALATKNHIQFRDTATHLPVGLAIPVSAAPAALTFTRAGSELMIATYDAVVRRVPTEPLTDPYKALCTEVGAPDTQVWDNFAHGETQPSTC